MDDSFPPRPWMVSAGMRNNLIYNAVPHIPILIEELPIYISLEEHEESGVKTIQTMGEIIPQTECDGLIVTLTPGNNSSFPVSFRNLRIEDVYVKNSDDAYCAIWEKYNVFKVFGTLQKDELGCIIEVTHLSPVDDVICSWNLLKLLTNMSRCDDNQYVFVSKRRDMLAFQWNKMKEEGKRLVKEKTK